MTALVACAYHLGQSDYSKDLQRDSSPLRIISTRYATGTWSEGEDGIDVYEIPTECLAAL
ncbi:hypothetical protein [Streptomyces sp. NPDC001948]